MLFYAWRPLLWLLVFLCWQAYPTQATHDERTDHPISGYALELLLAKLDYLQYKQLEMDILIKEHTEAIEQSKDQQENVFRSLLWAIDRLDKAVGFNLTTLLANSWKILTQQTACANHEQLRLEVSRFVPKPPSVLHSLFDTKNISRKEPFRSCKEEPSKVSGKYLIQASPDFAPFEAFCEQSVFGGGWLVIQHRFDGSENFQRNWTDYRDGFGSVKREFWLGLERMHQLTSKRTYELLIELNDFTDKYTYARYNQFQIDGEKDQYLIKQLGAFNGTAKDEFSDAKGMMFSTIDRDNDKYSGDCTQVRKGAWWHKGCAEGNLNSLRKNESSCASIFWEDSCKPLAYSRMMLRET